MAVVVAFRVALLLAPAGVRVLRWAEGPGVDTAVNVSSALWARLTDAGESDEDLSAALSAESGRMAEVATYTGSFELRKLQIPFEFTYSGTPGEDVRVMTFHFVKLAAGSPVETWLSGDFTTIETAFDAWWTTVKARIHAGIILSEYRWYKAGPAITPPQEPVRVVDRNVPGTMITAGTVPLPPQVAMSVTEITGSRKAWGRFYIPGFCHWELAPASGRWVTSQIGAVADACDTFYEACRTANTPVVVYSAAKPERPKKPSGTLPAIGARALTVDQIQVDDVPDVIRSRRFDKPLLKVQRAIG